MWESWAKLREDEDGDHPICQAPSGQKISFFFITAENSNKNVVTNTSKKHFRKNNQILYLHNMLK